MTKQKQKKQAEPYVIIRAASREQRQKFRKICKSQDITMGRALRQLIQSVVDGQLVFEEGLRIKNKNDCPKELKE